jgi:hypothetical protein
MPGVLPGGAAPRSQGAPRGRTMTKKNRPVPVKAEPIKLTDEQRQILMDTAAMLSAVASGPLTDITEVLDHVERNALSVLRKHAVGLSPDKRRLLDGLDAAAQALGKRVKDWKDEASRLLAAVDGPDMDAIEAYVRDNPPSPTVIAFLVLVTRKRYRSDIARQNAMARVDARIPAREFVLKAWTRDRDGYRSKAEFARLIHPQVRSRFPRIEITSRTIERDWLPKGGHRRQS